jgi:hypothetical protein
MCGFWESVIWLDLVIWSISIGMVYYVNLLMITFVLLYLLVLVAV